MGSISDAVGHANVQTIAKRSVVSAGGFRAVSRRNEFSYRHNLFSAR